MNQIEEVNPIVFYSLLYRISELLVRKQIQDYHPTGDGKQEGVSFNYDLLVSFVEEFYKIFLLFSVSGLKKKEEKNDWQVSHFAVVSTVVGIFCTGSAKFFFPLLLLSFMRGTLICCSVTFIRNSRGRLAGFLDLFTAVLESVLFLTFKWLISSKLENFPHQLFAIAASSATLIWYAFLDFGALRSIVGSTFSNPFARKKSSPFSFFIFLGLMKFIEYPNLPRVYPTAFMVDDVMNDVFVMSFMFCLLFMKNEEKQKRNLESLVNTIAISYFVVIFIATLYLEGDKDKYIFKIMVTNAQISTMKSMMEMLYLRFYLLQDTSNIAMAKIFCCLVHLAMRFLNEELLLFVNPFLNSGLICFYLIRSDDKLVNMIPVPGRFTSVLFFLLWFTPMMDG